MSFSRAKRFNYKQPDTNCSPADYLLNLELEKGYSMPKCQRFQNGKDDDDNSTICSRSSHAHCTQSYEDHNYRGKQDNKFYNRISSEFNRNDAKRKSIKASKKNYQTENDSLNSFSRFKDLSINSCSEADEEFIDDDYGSWASSEDLDTLKGLEEYEFNEVYKAVKSIKERRLAAARTRSNNNLNFQDVVLKKLETIDRNVKTIKEDMRNEVVESLHYQYRSLPIQPSTNQQDIKNVIVRTVQKLRNNFEHKRKSMLRDNQEHLLDIFDKMYRTSDKSSAQMKELCNTTADDLITNLSNVLQSSICSSENEIENLVEEFVERYYCNDAINRLDNEPLQNLISDYLMQTQEVSQELEEDLSDITLKCEDTHQMLHFQGVLLDEMKLEIENLKFGMSEV